MNEKNLPVQLTEEQLDKILQMTQGIVTVSKDAKVTVSQNTDVQLRAMGNNHVLIINHNQINYDEESNTINVNGSGRSGFLKLMLEEVIRLGSLEALIKEFYLYGDQIYKRQGDFADVIGISRQAVNIRINQFKSNGGNNGKKVKKSNGSNGNSRRVRDRFSRIR